MKLHHWAIIAGVAIGAGGVRLHQFSEGIGAAFVIGGLIVGVVLSYLF